MKKSSTADKIEENSRVIKKEVMWLMGNITPVSVDLCEAIKNCEHLISEIKSGQE